MCSGLVLNLRPQKGMLWQAQVKRAQTSVQVALALVVRAWLALADRRSFSLRPTGSFELPFVVGTRALPFQWVEHLIGAEVQH